MTEAELLGKLLAELPPPRQMEESFHHTRSLIRKRLELLSPDAPPRVSLTPAAEHLLPDDGNLRWLVERITLVGLPPSEVSVEVGVKARIKAMSQPVRALLESHGNVETDKALAIVRHNFGAISREGVQLVAEAYELRATLECIDGARAAIPVSWHRAVFDNLQQRDALFQTRMRFLLSELGLARYGWGVYERKGPRLGP